MFTGGIYKLLSPLLTLEIIVALHFYHWNASKLYKKQNYLTWAKSTWVDRIHWVDSSLIQIDFAVEKLETEAPGLAASQLERKLNK